MRVVIQYHYRTGWAQSPSQVAADCVGTGTDGPTIPRGAQRNAPPYTHSGGTRLGGRTTLSTL